jgi:argininosuccinate lyase
VEFLSACAVLMMHLSRIAEDLVIWSSAEFGFAVPDDAYATGSSMMPQKKNPDSLELVRGKTGGVYGNLFAMLTVLKGLPFSYCRDLQEDKRPFFETVRTVRSCLGIMTGTVRTMTFNPERMLAAIDPSMYATDIADYLTAKGIPFRKAHEIAGGLVRRAQESGVTVDALPFEAFREVSDRFGEDVTTIFDPAVSTDRRDITGGTGLQSIRAQIAHARGLMKKEGA